MDREDLKLHPLHFAHLQQFLQLHHYPLPEIDAMATSLNCQLPKFCSRYHHKDSTHINFFQVPWGHHYLAIYINPPFSIIHKVIQHLSANPPHHTYLLAPQTRNLSNWHTWLNTHSPWRLQLPLHPDTFTTLPNCHQRGFKTPTYPLFIYYIPKELFHQQSPFPIVTIPFEQWTTPTLPSNLDGQMKWA